MAQFNAVHKLSVAESGGAIHGSSLAPSHASHGSSMELNTHTHTFLFVAPQQRRQLQQVPPSDMQFGWEVITTDSCRVHSLRLLSY